MHPHIIGVSGKIGSGKNYFSETITKFLINHGYTVKEASFATPLKEEASLIVADFSSFVNEDEETQSKHLTELAVKYNMKFDEIKTLFNYVEEDLKVNPNLIGYDRTEGMRRLLQHLGTNIRRKQYNNYWVDKFENFVPKDCDFVFVTDVRFINEANSVVKSSGTLTRVEVPPEVILERVKGRDGLLYSEEALNHPSEVALDDYTDFDIIIGSSFDTESIGNAILSRAGKLENKDNTEG